MPCKYRTVGVAIKATHAIRQVCDQVADFHFSRLQLAVEPIEVQLAA
jgi:hypothetical protein